jgi:hypothetical protein
MSSEIKVDTISEKTSDAGVTIDGLLIKDGAIPSIAGSGLVHINTSTFSTASSHSIDNCFSATYTNYKIVINLSAVTGSNIDFLVRLRVSSSDATTNYRTVRQFANGTSITVDTDPTGTDDWTLGFITGTGTDVHSGTIDLFNPFSATTTNGLTSFNGEYGAAHYLIACDWANTNATSYDGITFFPASGTISGTVSVYGYATS